MLTVAVVAAVAALTACGSDEGRDLLTASTDTRVSPTASSAVTTSAPVVSAAATPAVTTPAPAVPTPTCSTFFRATVTIPPGDGPVLTFETSGRSEADFADLHLTAIYSNDGYDSPSLAISVETMPDRALVFASLYQFADPAADLHAFSATGQGFTGLISVYNPGSGSELQFFCSVD